MAQVADVAIVGGGVIGGAVAYFLAAEPGFRGRVVVIERDPTYAHAATALSVGGVRQQFSTPENIRMSRFGAEFFEAAGEILAVDGERPDLSFHKAGYLVLATAAGLAALMRNHRVQGENGAENVVLEAAELKRRFPFLDIQDLAAGSLGLAHEGWLDPYSLLQAFRRKARALGVVFLADEVVGFKKSGSKIAAVLTRRHRAVPCGIAVNAAGPGAGKVARLAGLDLPVEPRKRCVFRVTCPEPVALQNLLVDPSGTYVRPERDGFLCGTSPDSAQDGPCDPDDFAVDHTLFEEQIWPALAHRIPAFERLKARNAWAGHYDFNALDQNAVLGAHPEIGNFLFANGFSGHGLQQAPAAGRAIAELVVHSAYRALNLARFGFARIAAGEPLAEEAII